MVTLEKLELYEDEIIDHFKYAFRNHPFIMSKFIMTSGLIILLFSFVIMYWAAYGIGTGDAHYQAEVAIGNVTQEKYESVKWVFDISIWIYNIVMVMIGIVYVSFLIFAFYLLAKFSLKSKEK